MQGILEKGRNCGIIVEADRAALLVDAGNYFNVLEGIFPQARRSILIVGWDFDGRICLHGQPKSADEAIGPFLRRLVECNPDLEVRILIWSLSLVHAPGEAAAKLFGAPWQKHPRIKMRLDWNHPFYACRHQKIVAVDDSIAFVGGIDLTVGRRDMPGHRYKPRRRRDPDGRSYGPVHDVQLMVAGPAARALADLARNRWRSVTGEVLKTSPPQTLWPADIAPEFEQAEVAISCTAPAWHGKPAVMEGMQLTHDTLMGARRTLYIEAQYFTADVLADILVPGLERPQGPEILLVISGEWHSQIERLVLGRNRDRLLRRLKRADRYGRLAAFYPTVPDRNNKTSCVLVHSKVVIMDDQVVRIGSSNLNNRSMGLDGECDLALHARNEQQRASIAALRHRLIAEHLGVAPNLLAASAAQHNSLLRAVAALNQAGRLAPIRIDPQGPVVPVFGTGLVDPAQPFRWPWTRSALPVFASRKTDSVTEKAISPSISGNR